MNHPIHLFFYYNILNKIVELKKAKKTDSSFICAGQVLAINIETSNTDYITIEFAGDSSIITLDNLTKKFEWDDPRERSVKTRYASLKSLQDMYGGMKKIMPYKTREEKSFFKFVYVIPYGTKQTLHSWSSLREISKDAFSIDESKLFSRKESAYKLVIKVKGGLDYRTKQYTLDIAERWDELYNRDLSKYVK